MASPAIHAKEKGGMEATLLSNRLKVGMKGHADAPNEGRQVGTGEVTPAGHF